MPSSRLKMGIARVLKDEGYIASFDRVDDDKQGVLRIDLRYGPRGEDVVVAIRRESKPGRRLYRGVDALPKVLDGLGVAIVSTSQGVLSDRECRARGIGGELLCTVY